MDYLIQLIKQFIHMILHMDFYLNSWITDFGPWIYVILFLIIFAETGLVIAPFLPGDSLLFALGALCAVENAFLDLSTLMTTLIIAAILGDAVNYSIGKFVGPKVFSKDTGRILNKNHLMSAHDFFERHGGKAIIIARFAPIIRTFVPFVAGIARMSYSRFLSYNVVGGIVWVAMFLVAGFYFGNLPAVKKNFHIVIFAIIFISLLPVASEYAKVWRAKRSRLN